MAFNLPPPPTSNDPKDPAFRDWFYKLQKAFSTLGSFLFTNLDFTGSNITSILTRNHNDLQNIQGGNATENYHLTSSEYTGTGTGTFVRQTNPDIIINNISGATYTKLQEFINTMHSPGRITGGQITDAGSGNISVASGTGMIRVADDNVSSLPFFNWATTVISIPNDSVARYIGVVYNGGSPIVEARTVFDWDKDTEIPLGSAVQVSGVMFVFSNPYWVGDPITNIIQRFDAVAPAQRDNLVGGLILGETGTRNITVSGGVIWARLNDFTITAKNTSTGDTIGTAYYNGTSWVFTLGVTQWPNTQYNDITSGLVTMNNNYYTNLWFYLAIDSGVIGMIYGQDQYNQLSDAQEEAPPTFVPTNWNEHTLLIGRLTFQKSASTATEILSAFETIFSLSPISDHNSLSNLQGGTTAEYYHLTASQHTDLTDGGDTSLHFHSSDRNLANATGVLDETNGGTNQTSYTTGDILYASASNTLSKLPIGSEGEGLIVASGIPSWGSVTSLVKVYEPTVVAGFDLNVTYVGMDPTVPAFVTDSNGDIVMAWGGDYAA